MAHDCVVGDFARISPGACLCGGVSVGEDVLVGGTTAINLDVRETTDRDRAVVIPAILLAIFLVLVLLLRALVAPLLLLVANVLSFGATLGISAVVFDTSADVRERTRALLRSKDS